MTFEIKFDDLELATEFAQQLKEKNLRGVKVSQAEKEPEDGTLGVEEYMPLIMLAVKSGVATAVVAQVFGLLKGLLVENKNTNSKERIEMEKIKSRERIAMAKIEADKQNNENKAKYIEFSVECNGKSYTFKFTQNDEKQINNILEIVKNC